MNYFDYITAIKQKEAQAILNIPIENNGLYEAICSIKACSGKVVTSGMGKAGIAARKAAATMSSLGTPACFVHPGEAQHGDLGTLSANDILLVFSTSGKTREVIELVTLAKVLHEKVPVITVTSHPESELKDISDIVIGMGEVEEVCPFGLAPTSSTIVMLCIGDILSMCVMQEKGITKEEYGKRHHGGYIGKQLR